MARKVSMYLIFAYLMLSSSPVTILAILAPNKEDLPSLAMHPFLAVLFSPSFCTYPYCPFPLALRLFTCHPFLAILSLLALYSLTYSPYLCLLSFLGLWAFLFG